MNHSERTFHFRDAETGLFAVLCIDSTALGPAAGGIRTWTYASEEQGIADAHRLASAMSRKCALGGLAAGGAKTVVFADRLKDRHGAFAKLARFIEELNGLYHCAGDLGTTASDLEIMAQHCRYVHQDEGRLAEAVAQGHEACLEALLSRRSRAFEGLRVAVQGCGAIGAAIARRLKARGASLILADIDAGAVSSLANELKADTCSSDEILFVEADIVAPCAIGGVIDAKGASALRAWGICGGANNILHGPDAADALLANDIAFVPDELSSAGAVIDGIARSVMKVEGPSPLIDGLRQTCLEVLEAAEERQQSPALVAAELAQRRIDEASH